MRSANDVPIIAVVDDDEAVQVSISSLLHSAGYRSEAYRSAEAFLDACAMQLPDCAILDFRLPGLNGLELQRMLSEFGHAIPIIMVSAYDDRVRTKALEQGALIVLGKPFGGETLLAAIRSALESSEPESGQEKGT
jgi:FixJ family two-component response regulator